MPEEEYTGGVKSYPTQTITPSWSSNYQSSYQPPSPHSDKHSGSGGSDTGWTDKGKANVQKQADDAERRLAEAYAGKGVSESDVATGKFTGGKQSSSIFGKTIGGDTSTGSGDWSGTVSKLQQGFLDEIENDLTVFHDNQQKSGWTFFTGKHKIESKNEDILMLYDAARRMAVALGLDPNKQKDMQVALNYLSGDEWGRQLNLKTGDNAATIDKIIAEAADKDGWKTWGTGLRSAAETRYTGNTGLTKDDYTLKLDILAGNFEPGTPIYKYQRMLIDANKGMRVGVSGLERIFANGLSFLGPGGALSSFALKGAATKNGQWEKPETKTEKFENPLGILVDIEELDPEKGITSYEYRGTDYTINDAVPSHFTASRIKEWDSDSKHKDLDDNDSYSSTSYQAAISDLDEDFIDTEEDDEVIVVQSGQSSNVPLFMDWTLFEKIFKVHKGFS